MKKIILIILLSIQSLQLNAQWNFQCDLPLYSGPAWYKRILDASFLTPQEGIYTDYYYISPSSGMGLRGFRTTDGGNTWQGIGGVFFFDVYFSAAIISQHTYYLAGGFSSPKIIKSTDAITWTTVITGNFKLLSAIDSSHLYLADTLNMQTVLSKYESGNPLLSYNIIDNFTASEIQFLTTTEGFIIGDSGIYNVVMKSDDGGISWNTQFTDSNSTFNDITFGNSTFGYIFSNDGKIFRTGDNGNTWNNIPSVTTENLYCGFTVNDSVIYAGGNSGLIINSTDFGDTWNTTNLDSAFRVVKLFAANDSTGIAILKDFTNPNLINAKVYTLNFITGIWSDIETNKTPVIFPNPSSDYFTLQSFSNKSSNFIFILRDIAGKEIERLEQIYSGHDFTFGDKLIPGIYFAEIHTENQMKAFKIVKQ